MFGMFIKFQMACIPYRVTGYKITRTRNKLKSVSIHHETMHPSIHDSRVLLLYVGRFFSFLILYTAGRSRDSIVGIVTGYGLESR
jgi:hypothetical protein